MRECKSIFQILKLSLNERLQTYVREHNIVDIEVQDTDDNDDNDDDDRSDEENEGDDLDENASPDAGVFEGTLSNMEGGGDQAIIDRWQLRLAEEDDNDYRWRMDSPPDDVIAAATRMDERLGRSGSSSSVEVSTTALQAAPAAGVLSVASGNGSYRLDGQQLTSSFKRGDGTYRLNCQQLTSSCKPNPMSTNIWQSITSGG